MKIAGHEAKMPGHKMKMAGHKVKIQVENWERLVEREKLRKIPIHFPEWMLRLAGWMFLREILI